jgi:protoporphyrinogen/coproporphyrinogen III oxidase
LYHSTKMPSNYAIGYPRIEKTLLDAITIASDFIKAKIPTTLVKIYANGEKGKEICSKTDKEIEKSLLTAASSMKSVFDVQSKSSSTYIQRWPEAIPEFEVGHFKRLREFMDGKIESTDKKIVFAGDYIGGPFIEGAFTSGMQAAERLHNLFNS